MQQNPPISPRSATSLPASPGSAAARRRKARRARLATFSVLVAALMIGLSIERLTPGMLTRHMITHIFAMSIVAPALAWIWHPNRYLPVGRSPLIVSTISQLVLFILWHSPAGMQSVAHFALGELLMIGSLLASAVWFWACVFDAVRHDRLEAVPALLLTGKIVCLMAALMVFAPRLLFHGGEATAPAHMAMFRDQQLAGLIMLVACPLTYIGASVYMVARWLSNLSAHERGSHRE